MTDIDVLEIGLLKNGNIKNIVVTEKYLNRHKEFAMYLKNRYNDIPEDMFSYREVIWRIKYGIEKRPVCEACGKPVSFIGKQSKEKSGKTKNGYLTFCCRKCSNNDAGVKAKVKDTFTKQYGEKRRGPREKFEKTMISKYGVKNALQNEELLKKAKSTINEHYGVSSPAKSCVVKEKMAKTNIEKYGYIAPACSKQVSDKIKQTNIAKYGADSYFKSYDYKLLREKHKKEWVEKAINSALRNGTRYSSKPEKKMYEILCSIVGQDDIIRQHKTREYPFLCDFYLVKENIFIEYNGTYFHNDCLFDEIRDREKYLNLLEKCTDEHPTYKRILDVWVYGDVRKYNTAKNNDLNFIFLYKNWDEDWVSFTKGRVSYSVEKITEHLKNIIYEQVNNKSVRVIGEKV